MTPGVRSGGRFRAAPNVAMRPARPPSTRRSTGRLKSMGRVRSKLDFLVTPLRCPVLAGDDSRAVDAAED